MENFYLIHLNKDAITFGISNEIYCEALDGEKLPAGWENYGHEYTPFLISEKITIPEAVIGISFNIPEDVKYQIAHHVLASGKGTVFFFSENGNEPLHLERDKGLFKNKAIKLYSYQKVQDILSDPEQAGRIRDQWRLHYDHQSYLDSYPKPSSLDRHQIINEWGIIKLLLNYGLTLDEIEKNILIPKTIFYKHKIDEQKIRPSQKLDLSTYSNADQLKKALNDFAVVQAHTKKVLLIDDNSDKGWKFALSNFFPNAQIEDSQNYQDALSYNFSGYDLIFLDLRLPYNISDQSLKIEHGKALISHIKNDEASLDVPLIIFTASQKATTLGDIWALGADDMYIKESPEYTAEESVNNFLDFITKINVQYKKYKILKKYWRGILSIKNNLLPEITNSGNLLYKDRIEERLKMFYGLLKKSFEQSSYNEATFHYSSHALAYITLWSILNEIQECFYEKVKQRYINHGTPVLNRNGTPFIYLSHWHLKNHPVSLFFKKVRVRIMRNNRGRILYDANGICRIEFGYRYRCYLSYDNKAAPYYSLDASGNTRTWQPDQKLSFQIAFLILANNAHQASVHKDHFLVLLKNHNDIRNKLYLTHGADADSGFYNKLEKDKVVNSGDLEELFSLVRFLLTAVR